MGIHVNTVLRRAQFRTLLAVVTAVAAIPCVLYSQDQPDAKLFSNLQWRLIGPFRAGRVTSVAGASDPSTFYFGTPGGGVWKTTDG